MIFPALYGSPNASSVSLRFLSRPLCNHHQQIRPRENPTHPAQQQYYRLTHTHVLCQQPQTKTFHPIHPKCHAPPPNILQLRVRVPIPHRPFILLLHHLHKPCFFYHFFNVFLDVHGFSGADAGFHDHMAGFTEGGTDLSQGPINGFGDGVGFGLFEVAARGEVAGEGLDIRFVGFGWGRGDREARPTRSILCRRRANRLRCHREAGRVYSRNDWRGRSIRCSSRRLRNGDWVLGIWIGRERGRFLEDFRFR